VRFELTYTALNPRLKIIAPWREWKIRSREDAVAYAKLHGIALPPNTGKSLYSRDRNLWHLSHEGGPLENLANAPEEAMFQISTSPEKAPDAPEILDIGFEAGNPVRINGRKLSPAKLIETLNAYGGRHGIGRVDLVENRLVGMKSRGVYETPGGTILVAVHRELESITQDRETQHYKQLVAQRFAEIVYFGQWFTPLRESLQAFIDDTQKKVTGTIRVKLYKGNVIVLRRSSPYSLYREDYATFGHSDVYDHQDAEGFIHLYGLPLKVRALIEQGGKGVPAVRPDEIQRD
jgi:argininosuccinate synthase